jgi:hypothetical protein
MMSGWQPSPDEPAEAVFELYRQEMAAADAVLAVPGWARMIHAFPASEREHPETEAGTA